MVIWSQVTLGELRDAVADSRAALAALRPGQVIGWALHLCSWRMNATTLTGDWDETLATADHARQLWLDLDRAPAGYTGQGLSCAIGVARARGDGRRLDDLLEMADEISVSFTSSSRWGLYRDLRTGRSEVDSATLLDAAVNAPSGVERWLNQANDLGVQLPEADLRHLLELARRMSAAPMEVQVRRAIGLTTGALEALESAHAIASRIGAAPGVARLDCEIGARSGSRERVASGRQRLRELGDLAALDRYEGS
jgi:hypothetical protein